MPFLELKTNVKAENVKQLVLELTDFAHNVLKKEKQHISVEYTYSENLAFGGTFDPAYILTVNNLFENAEENDQLFGVFFKFLEEKLGVPNDRAYVLFNDPGLAQIGYYGRSLKVLFSDQK